METMVRARNPCQENCRGLTMPPPSEKKRHILDPNTVVPLTRFFPELLLRQHLPLPRPSRQLQSSNHCPPVVVVVVDVEARQGMHQVSRGPCQPCVVELTPP